MKVSSIHHLCRAKSTAAKMRRRGLVATTALLLLLMLLVLTLAPIAVASNEDMADEAPAPMEEQQHHQEPQEQEHEPQQQQQSEPEPDASHGEYPPVVQDESPPPPAAEEEPPQEQEQQQQPAPEDPVPAEQQQQQQDKETPPVQESSNDDDDDADVNNDNLFELTIFECVAPRGDPAPARAGPMVAGAIMTLCIRPKHESSSTKLQAVVSLDYSVTSTSTKMQVVKNNEALDPMTRVVCPFRDDSNLCITATKLHESLFTQAATATAQGQMVVQVAGGEQRTVPFAYDFQVEKSKPQVPLEHDYFPIPTTPPPFPCGKEIRVWIISAILLTLLEFAFTPSEPDNDKQKQNNTGTAEKKKKPKKE